MFIDKKQDSKCTYNVRLRRVRLTIVLKEKQQVLHFLGLALLIRHAKRMRRIMLSSGDCLTLLYISTLYHKWHDFRKKSTEQKICVLCLSLHFF